LFSAGSDAQLPRGLPQQLPWVRDARRNSAAMREVLAAAGLAGDVTCRVGGGAFGLISELWSLHRPCCLYLAS
jgi:hypothetical protein